jgi:phosphoserine phosphatase
VKPGTIPKVLFVDLDGTLVLDNSYHLFLWSIWVAGGWNLRVALVRAALARAFRGGNGRTRMKQCVLHAFAQAGPDRQRVVVRHTLAKMNRTVSRPVLARVSAYRDQGWLVVLATAAPECYARPFAEALGFDDCLATPRVATSEEWVELMGVQKADSCRAWVEGVARDTIPEIAVISDHLDDLPLLQMASRVVIQAPPDDAASLIEGLSAETQIEQVDPVGRDEHGGMWLWINDCPAGPYDPWEVETILSKHRYALLYRGDSRWGRVLPGHSLAGAALRVECPRPPAPRDRMSVAARRLIVRDFLGVFH